ncbi:MAG: transposase [Halothiobacillaceae bacterium]|nr:transposase [Halothiobacillaceae bacterium]
MTNHVHLLITPHKDDGISKSIQMLGRYYVQYFNHTYHRSGTLWEGRYKANLIDSEAYALICYRYIELNPVRAHMVNHPAEYPWSSFRGNALGVDDALLTPHPLFLALGKVDSERQIAYQALFEAHLDDKTLNDVRSALNKAWVLGSDYFLDKIATQLNRRATPLPKGGNRQVEAAKEPQRI